MLDTDCLANPEETIGGADNEDVDKFPGRVEESEQSEIQITVEVILGVLALTIILIIVCIIWVSCHPTKATEEVKDT